MACRGIFADSAVLYLDKIPDFYSAADYCPRGALGFAGAELLEPIISDKIAKCRSDDGQVIFTLDTHGENYLETAEGKNFFSRSASSSEPKEDFFITISLSSTHSAILPYSICC